MARITIAALVVLLALGAGSADARRVHGGKLRIVGFAVAPINFDNPGAIPSIPAKLTRSGGTITSCGGAVPKSTPTRGSLATLLVVTKFSGIKGPARAACCGSPAAGARCSASPTAAGRRSP